MIVEPKRHLLKTISYRIVSSSIGFVLFFIATDNFKFSASFTIAEFLYKPIVYFLHERFFYKYVKYGLKKEVEKSV
jgi:uncharacterized membrane protein